MFLLSETRSFQKRLPLAEKQVRREEKEIQEGYDSRGEEEAANED